VALVLSTKRHIESTQRRGIARHHSLRRFVRSEKWLIIEWCIYTVQYCERDRESECEVLEAVLLGPITGSVFVTRTQLSLQTIKKCILDGLRPSI
jgi:hypothetical protein